MEAAPAQLCLVAPQDPGEAIWKSTRVRGMVPAGTQDLRQKWERKSHQQRHLPRAARWGVVLALGPWQQANLVGSCGASVFVMRFCGVAMARRWARQPLPIVQNPDCLTEGDVRS